MDHRVPDLFAHKVGIVVHFFVNREARLRHNDCAGELLARC
jgi:hypothetical protein